MSFILRSLLRSYPNPSADILLTERVPCFVTHCFLADDSGGWQLINSVAAGGFGPPLHTIAANPSTRRHGLRWQ
uniref:Uncharacterized protein n=1 Tax=Arundo donax TaxID=35708 RepID=A0A0A9G1T2_ARUDO